MKNILFITFISLIFNLSAKAAFLNVTIDYNKNSNAYSNNSISLGKQQKAIDFNPFNSQNFKRANSFLGHHHFIHFFKKKDNKYIN